MTIYSNAFSGTLTTSGDSFGNVTQTDAGTLSLGISIDLENDVVGSGTITDTSVEIVPEPHTNFVLSSTSTDTERVGGAVDVAPPGDQVIAQFFLSGQEASFGGNFNNAQTEIVGTLSFSDGNTVSVTLFGQPALPPIISFDSGSLRVNSNAGFATYTLSRGPVPLGDLGSTVHVSTADGTAVSGRDYTALTNFAVVFAPGASTASFSVPIFFDSTDAGAHINPDFSVILSNPVNASIGIGTADTTIVEAIPVSSGQTVTISAGQTSGGLGVQGGGVVTVQSGGAAIDMVIGSGGIAVVFGAVSGTTIAGAAQLYLQSGGAASGTAISSGGDEFVEFGGSTSGTVANGGSEVVYGTASGTVLNSGSYLYLNSGTTIGAVVNSGVEIVLALASGTTDNSGGFDFVEFGGTAIGTTVNGGVEYVETGAVAIGTVVEGGAQVVYGTADGTILDNGASAYFESGSQVSGTVVNSGLAVILGVASATAVASGGYDFVEPGAHVVGTVISGLPGSAQLSGGEEFIESGAAATGTTLSGGAQVVYGTTTGTVVDSGGYQYVYPGGTASATIINNGGVESIFELAVGTIVNSGGEDFVYAGRVSGSIVDGGAELVELATSASQTLVSGAGGAQFVYGTALATTLVSGGDQVVEAGGVASATVAGSGGYEFVASGGTAAAATISGGTVELTSGAVVTAAIGFAESGGGLLRLDDPQHFSGTVAGFAVPDRIDLIGIAFGSGTISAFQEAAGNLSGTLTIGDGTHTANLALLGQYTIGQFRLSDDGSGGTLVSDPPPAGQAELASPGIVASHQT